MAIRDALFRSLRFCAALLPLFVAGCGDERGRTVDYQPRFADRPSSVTVRQTYRFGIHPLHNPSRLFEVYGPLVALLNQRIPEANFVLEASRNYEEFDKKLYAGHFDVVLPNPYQTLKAIDRGYRVFGKMGDDAAFRGIFVVRRDSGIRTFADLKGKAVSFPAKTALAAAMLPQHFLHKNGLPLGSYEPRYVGSQESSIMNVALGNTVAGATWPPPWIAFQKEHPEQAAALEIRWETSALINNSLMARNDLPLPLLQKISDILFSLHDTPEGKRILERLPLSRFDAATNDSYRPVRDFVAVFARTVRPLDE